MDNITSESEKSGLPVNDTTASALPLVVDPSPDSGVPELRKDVIDFGGIMRNYLRHWWWFAISLLICLGGALFYIKKKTPVYLIQGLIMVNQQEDGGMAASGAMSALMSSMGFGAGSGSANPENEQMKMSSHTMLQKVVTTLDLNTTYWQNRGFWKRRLNYYKNEPIKVSLPAQVLDTLSMSTKFTLKGDAKGPWTLEYKQDKHDGEMEVKSLPYDAKTPYGTYRIEATKHFPKSGELNVSALYMSNQDAVDWLQENITVAYVSNRADALLIGLDDPIIERGKEIVNTLMDLYNEGRDADRVAYNKSVLDFIDNRLLSLYHELETSESKIEQYKKDHKVVSAEAEAEYIFARKGAMEQSTVELQAGIQIMEMIQQMLTSPDTKYSLIPFSGSGSPIAGEGYMKLLESYNDLVMQRMNLAASAKSGNTALTKIDEQLDALRHNILSSVNRELQAARINYKTLAAEQTKGNSRMSEIPSMEHELVTLYRDREVQNAIYAFLLQKREETQIALSQSQPVGKIIDRAYAQTKPVAPKSVLIICGALLLAFGVPAVALQLRRRKD